MTLRLVVIQTKGEKQLCLGNISPLGQTIGPITSQQTTVHVVITNHLSTTMHLFSDSFMITYVQKDGTTCFVPLCDD